MDRKPATRKPTLPDTESATFSTEEGLLNPVQIQVSRNPELPPEVANFKAQEIPADNYLRLTAEEWEGALHGAEIKDKLQQIKLRPWFAIGVFVLISVQNVGIWFIVVSALRSNQLADLQLIFGTLIAGTLTQSYFILKFITNKVFSDIDYHNGEGDKH